MANVIFDFDGTIADTFALIVDVSYELTGAKRLPEEEIESLRSLPILVAIRRLGGGVWHIPKLMAKTRPMMRKRMVKVPIFDGMAEALASLHRAGHRLLILSSNNTSNVSAFLQTHELTADFEAINTVPYGNAWFKARRLRKVIKRLGLDPATSFYVGNEPLDVRAAQKVGMKSVAVTWSGQSDADLHAAKPDYVIAKPAELSKLFIR